MWHEAWRKWAEAFCVGRVFAVDSASSCIFRGRSTFVCGVRLSALCGSRGPPSTPRPMCQSLNSLAPSMLLAQAFCCDVHRGRTGAGGNTDGSSMRKQPVHGFGPLVCGKGGSSKAGLDGVIAPVRPVPVPGGGPVTRPTQGVTPAMHGYTSQRPQSWFSLANRGSNLYRSVAYDHGP